ncbi:MULTISPECIES: hypothetical protein [Nocardiopsis]|uniref:Uncharacterized protein n=1 Tax=Nocardiopsis changdeensis TaxID=2831969 RepID=A0ABX8BXC9_9ACTN|nr:MULTISPECIES: hypothetical protein [Nocardiopsis]QUX26350.1 hypothetical protein KGD84_32130 [Nocardiopsis changdeensis]QYX40830.1 hypothetical protein K1J57_33045 [Nocardiopsis sp. MT53]
MTFELHSEYQASRKMAERLAKHAADQADPHPDRAAALAAAGQVYATLALAAATKLAAELAEDDD